ncbi:MAG: dockerin type I repeat-containing protein [Clostridia bacterium]|nr:dockerin type I repeat-containing protein [Clostridia bacterium]
MKKLFCVIVSVIIFVGCFCVTAAAAGNGITVSVDVPQSVAVGKEFVATVEFSANTGFNTLGVTLTYPEGFTYVEDSSAVSAIISEKCYLDFAGYAGETYAFYHDETSRTITFVGASLYDIENESGELFSVSFEAPAQATANNAFAVEIIDEIYNAAGETVTVTKNNGTTDVVEKTILLGDINENKTVDFIDATMALQSFMGSITLTEYQSVAGDVNKDGRVDFMDATAILQMWLNS